MSTCPEEIMLGPATSCAAPAPLARSTARTAGFQPARGLRCAIRVLFMTASLLLLANPATATTVGPAASCDYHTIQAAINASAALGAGIILIAPGQYDEVLDVNNEALVLVGNPPNGCTSDAGPVTINGFGHQRAVMNINGASSIYLFGLSFENGGGASDQHGGGIYYNGHGTLELSAVTLAGNMSGYGGGLSVSSSGGHTDVRIHSNTLIENNRALTDGGGIHVDGDTRLYVLEPETTIFFNRADRNGGGIDVTGPARADIGSAGYLDGAIAVIQGNAAGGNGGGIHARAQSNDDTPVVRLFTTDAQQPVTLRGNSAGMFGGGVYLKPFSSVIFPIIETAEAVLCAYDFRIAGNFATDGAAIYADVDTDALGNSTPSEVELNVDAANGLFTCNPEPTSLLGGTACAAGVACNEIADNRAQDASANATGATILLRDEADFRTERISLRHNFGQYVLHAPDDGEFSAPSLRNCLIADNEVSGELIHIAGRNSEVFIDACTIAHDSIGASHVIYSQSDFSIADSIIAEGSRSTLSQASGGLLVDSVMSENLSGLGVLGPPTLVQVEDPKFVDVSSGDYHLQPSSPAVDFAPASSALDDPSHLGNDLDNQPRVVDLPGYGGANPRDLGAYELQSAPPARCSAADTIFCDGFGI